MNIKYVFWDSDNTLVDTALHHWNKHFNVLQNDYGIVLDDIYKTRVYENNGGQLKEVANFYASIGVAGFKKLREGDQKTPVGVYRITGFIPGRKLHERYGSGALPIDYPNELDQFYERTGDGIWVHGTEPGFVNRAPRASDGMARSLERYQCGDEPRSRADNCGAEPVRS